MYETQRRRSFPLPDYDLNTPEQVRVTLSGRILDERYTRILMERSDLDLGLVMLLDHVQKGQRISRDDHRLLKRSGLVEGRYPSLMVSGTIARVVGETGRHIRERGLDKRYYLNVILELLREHGPATRRDVDEALISKLPDRLSAAQKKNKVHNLLQELAHGGLIMNTGSKQASRWELIASPPNPASEPQKIKEL
jgi:ATP-dependent DNA helicase RecG